MTSITNIIKKCDQIHCSEKNMYCLLLTLLLLSGSVIFIKIKSHVHQNTQVKSDWHTTTVSHHAFDHQRLLPMYHHFSYNHYSQRDPFHKVIKTSQINITNTLEKSITDFDVNTLKMIGFVTQNQYTLGIMQAPTGTVYFVCIDDLIGKEMAKVTAISQYDITAKLPNSREKSALVFNIAG